jgi:hypothetical protein
MKILMARRFFVKFVNIQSHEYPFSGSPVHMTNGYRQTERQTYGQMETAILL